MKSIVSVRKAVFPVAGFGTRFLPATKAMPKELLPIIDKPIIQYAVEEAIEAGVTDLIFITGRNKRAIGDHFDTNLELEAELEAKGKEEILDQVQSILPKRANCAFIRQPRPLGLGNAVQCAEHVVGDEPFCVLLPDDFFIPGETMPTEQLLRDYDRYGKSVISVTEVPANEVNKYGIVSAASDHSSETLSVSAIVEKPDVDNSPSNLASIGRYVLEPEIFNILRRLAPGHGGEIQLADAINIMAKLGQVRARRLTQRRYDCGNKFGYLEAIVDAALAHDGYGAPFRELIASRLSSRIAAE